LLAYAQLMASAETRGGGAGRCSPPWTSAAPATVLGAALFERFALAREADFADQLLSAMRKHFGGHAEITAAAR